MVRGQQYETLSTDPRAVRARLRRKNRKVNRTEDAMVTDLEMLYKPVDTWDMAELARGRPRCKDGTFKGPTPPWVTPLVRREAERRLVDLARAELATMVGDAIQVMTNLMTDDTVDEETGRPYVSASTKLDAAKFIVEQVMGKAKQRVDLEAGASVAEFLGQFSGGLVKRTGDTYKPKRGQIVIDEDGVEVND